MSSYNLLMAFQANLIPGTSFKSFSAFPLSISIAKMKCQVVVVLSIVQDRGLFSS